MYPIIICRDIDFLGDYRTRKKSKLLFVDYEYAAGASNLHYTTSADWRHIDRKLSNETKKGLFQYIFYRLPFSLLSRICASIICSHIFVDVCIPLNSSSVLRYWFETCVVWVGVDICIEDILSLSLCKHYMDLLYSARLLLFLFVRDAQNIDDSQVSSHLFIHLFGYTLLAIYVQSKRLNGCKI